MAGAIAVTPLADITAGQPAQRDPFALRPLNDVSTASAPFPSGLINPQTAVDALSSKVDANKAQIEATIEASRKNSAIATSLETTNEEIDNDTLDAYNKQMTITRYPPGIANLLGIFDKDWNGRYQTQRIQTNSLKADQAHKRAESMISINNQQPALEGFKASLAAQDYTSATQLLDLGVKFKGLEQEDAKIAISVAEYGLKAGDERRKALDFAVNQMTSAQLAAELKNAKAGKGDFANYPGFLEQRLRNENKAELELHQLRTAIQVGDAAAADSSALRFAQSIPNSTLQMAVNTAQNAGNPAVDLGPKYPKIPIHIAINAMKINGENEQYAREYNIQQSNQQYGNNLARVSSSISALALVDPEAARLSTTLTQGIANVDPKDYNSVQNANSLVMNIEKTSKEIAKRVAATMKTPEAKAGVIQFVENGQFSPEGAHAVVSNYAGVNGVATNSYHSDAYKILNNSIAGKVSKNDLGGTPSFDGSETSTAAILAALQRGGTTKLEEIKAEVLADPIVGKQMADAISSTIAVDQMKRVFSKKAKDPNSNAVWNEILTKPGYRDGTGSWDLGAVQARLEQESALAGGKIDFNQAFIEDMRNVAIQGDDGTTANKGMEAKALEMAVMGPDAFRAAMSDFLNRITVNAQAAHQQMKSRVDADRSGDTQRRAAAEALSGAEALTPKEAQQRYDEAIQNTPSATGAATTAERMRALYK